MNTYRYQLSDGGEQESDRILDTGIATWHLRHAPLFDPTGSGKEVEATPTGGVKRSQSDIEVFGWRGHSERIRRESHREYQKRLEKAYMKLWESYDEQREAKI